MDNYFKILSIDGGGIRGIIPAHILKRIKEELKLNDFYSHFDLIAGTSTGSIIAGALAIDLPIETILNLYNNCWKDIFKKQGNGFRKSKYSKINLEKILKDNFGNKTLTQTKTRLIIPATDIINANVFIHKSNYNENFVRDKETLIADAILSSCSAPSFFDPTNINNKYLLCDGGLWANNPSLICLIEALSPRLNIPIEKIKILSLGTGIFNKYYNMKNKKWGLLNWGTGLIETILSLQSKTPNNILGLLLNNNQYLRLDFDTELKLPFDKFDQKLISKADEIFTYKINEIKKFFKN